MILCQTKKLTRCLGGTEMTQNHIEMCEVCEITTRSYLAGLSTALHGIPYVLEDSGHVTHPLGNYKYLNDDISKLRNGRLIHQTLHATPEGEVHA
ncbi:hypothetical protein TNCV_1383821 [Trichonephila clavipes]|nr:hypothetical protein TNCV_1383821 [Trichonephila clavipes]